ncbi:MAG: hypothetical protein KGI41_03315 [Patescibacteria group bacterium]|nr:hypothetical protein [Patescibacteria group bacterium]MDE1966241.1 hypothetical protein [Patescibacteria group bacterium]
MKEEKRERISLVTAGFMTGIALLLDAFQAIVSIAMGVTAAATAGVGATVGVPIMFLTDWMVDMVAGVGFWVWFLLCDVNLNGKNAGAIITNTVLSAVIEAVPLLDVLPGITFGVVRTILLVRAEDALYNESRNSGVARFLNRPHPHRPQQPANDDAMQEAA